MKRAVSLLLSLGVILSVCCGVFGVNAQQAAKWESTKVATVSQDDGKVTVSFQKPGDRADKVLYTDIKDIITGFADEDGVIKFTVSFTYKATANEESDSVGGGAFFVYAVDKNFTNKNDYVAKSSAYFEHQAGGGYWPKQRGGAFYPTLTYDGDEYEYTNTIELKKEDIEQFDSVRFGVWWLSGIDELEICDFKIENEYGKTPAQGDGNNDGDGKNDGVKGENTDSKPQITGDCMNIAAAVLAASSGAVLIGVEKRKKASVR